MRAAVQEATSTLSRAFVQQHTQETGPSDGGDGSGGADTDQLDELLLESVNSPKVRVCARSSVLYAPCMYIIGALGRQSGIDGMEVQERDAGRRRCK